MSTACTTLNAAAITCRVYAGVAYRSSCVLNTMQACTAEAQQLNKSINLKHRVCSIFAKTRSDLQIQSQVCVSHGCPPKPPLGKNLCRTTTLQGAWVPMSKAPNL